MCSYHIRISGRRYYRNYARSKSHTFEEAWLKRQNEFRSIARQKYFEKYLHNISHSFILKIKSRNVEEVLEKLRESIIKLTFQGTRIHGSEEDQMKYLHHATM